MLKICVTLDHEKAFPFQHGHVRRAFLFESHFQIRTTRRIAAFYLPISVNTTHREATTSCFFKLMSGLETFTCIWSSYLRFSKQNVVPSPVEDLSRRSRAVKCSGCNLNIPCTPDLEHRAEIAALTQLHCYQPKGGSVSKTLLPTVQTKDTSRGNILTRGSLDDSRAHDRDSSCLQFGMSAFFSISCRRIQASATSPVALPGGLYNPFHGFRDLIKFHVDTCPSP